MAVLLNSGHQSSIPSEPATAPSVGLDLHLKDEIRLYGRLWGIIDACKRLIHQI